MPSPAPASAFAFLPRLLLAFASGAGSGVLAPVLVGILGVAFASVAGVPDTALRWGGILVAASLLAGLVAVAAARSHLRLGWIDASRIMRAPYGLAGVAFGTLLALARARLLQPGVFVESSPYLAMSVMALTAFSEATLGAFTVCLALGAGSRSVDRGKEDGH